MSIGKKVVDWYEAQGRDMPWRETRNPYNIWVAEVIMQQTRIEQGVKYYYRFIERFPDLPSLAHAPLDDVLKHWEGLGYYSRARNLHKAAQQLMDEYGGEFPTHHEELRKLKGIGPYTSRAIGSFAFGNACGVVDGNVMRVMSRVLNEFAPINQAPTKARFQQVIDGWVQRVDSRAFNHGIMDIGSIICTPTQPACLICPLEADCEARKAGSVHLLPKKEKKLRRKQRCFDFYLLHDEQGRIAIRQRPPEGYWGGLWEIPNEEVSRKAWNKKKSEWGGTYCLELKHVFSHFDMLIHVYKLPLATGEGLLSEAPFAEVQFIPSNKIPIFAFSKAVLNIFDRAWQSMD